MRLIANTANGHHQILFCAANDRPHLDLFRNSIERPHNAMSAGAGSKAVLVQITNDFQLLATFASLLDVIESRRTTGINSR
jgi:hypothetical protein